MVSFQFRPHRTISSSKKSQRISNRQERRGGGGGVIVVDARGLGGLGYHRIIVEIARIDHRSSIAIAVSLMRRLSFSRPLRVLVI